MTTHEYWRFTVTPLFDPRLRGTLTANSTCSTNDPDIRGVQQKGELKCPSPRTSATSSAPHSPWGAATTRSYGDVIESALRTSDWPREDSLSFHEVGIAVDREVGEVLDMRTRSGPPNFEPVHFGGWEIGGPKDAAPKLGLKRITLINKMCRMSDFPASSRCRQDMLQRALEEVVA